MMRSRFFLSVVGVVGVSAACGSHGQVSSTFDVNLDGWSVYNDGAITHDAAFGNPAGSARMVDFGSGSYFGFLAPAAYLGDKSSYYGGTLSFDIQTNNATTAGATQPDVRIDGGGVSIVLDLPVPTGGSWDNRSVALDDSEDWRLTSIGGTPATEADIRTVLGDVTMLRIRGEFSTQTSDVTHLDNVVLTPGSGCVADTNGDGILTPADFTAWIAAFNAMSAACDQNADSLCTPADFTAWIANYNAGC